MEPNDLQDELTDEENQRVLERRRVGRLFGQRSVSGATQMNDPMMEGVPPNAMSVADNGPSIPQQNFIPPQSQPDLDKYGIEKPHAPEQSKLRSFLAVALPAILSGVTGNGLLPGAAQGYIGMKRGQQESYDRDTRRYQQQLQAAMLQDYRNDLGNKWKRQLSEREAYSNRRLDETGRHNKVMESLGQARVNKPPKVSPISDRDKFISIQNKINAGATDLTHGELDWAEKMGKIYNKRGSSASKGGGVSPEALQQLKQVLKGN